MPVENGVELVTDNTEKIMKDFLAVAAKQLSVGILPSGAARQNPDTSNATIGYIRETGSPAKNIPPRPWLTPTINRMQDDISIGLAKAACLVFDNKDGPANTVLADLGETIQIALKNALKTTSAQDYASLQPETVAERARQQRIGISPKAQEEDLVNSISFSVGNR